MEPLTRAPVLTAWLTRLQAASFVTAATTFKLTISSSLAGSTPASTTIMVNPAPVVTVTPSAGSVTAGTAATTVNISVSNDVSGDTLTAALSGTVGGVACTTANGLCGSAGPSVSLVGISNGAGTYTVSYTPPASVPSSTAVTLAVTSSLAGSTAGTATITVNPAAAVSYGSALPFRRRRLRRVVAPPLPNSR